MKDNKLASGDAHSDLEGVVLGTASEKAVIEEMRKRRARIKRRVLLDYLRINISSDFLASSSHVAFLSGRGERDNAEALESWVDSLCGSCEQEHADLTPEFMTEAAEKLRELLENSLYQ
ncbi:MAG: hypothetical protein ABW149_01375 [Sedimenticola sp.]